MTSLLTSTAALVIGPLLYLLARHTLTAMATLDGFVFVAIGTLVVGVAIPHAIASAGLLAIVATVIGFSGPNLVERGLRRAAEKAHAVTLVLAIVGLVLHAFADGVALRHGGLGGPAQSLAVAVVLHRVPVGLTVWWLLANDYGRRWAVAALVAIAAATVVGYQLGQAAWFAAHFGLVRALVAGSLLHVMVHAPRAAAVAPTVGRWRLHAGIGGLLALTLSYVVVRLGGSHGPGHGGQLEANGVAEAFLSLAATSAPALLLAYLGAGLLDTFLPRASVAWMGRGSRLGQSLRGVGFGLPLPVCSCGVIPLYRSLVLRGAPVAAAMAFLVATPEIGIDAVLLSIPLLGKELTLTRVIAAATVAVGVGWWVARFVAPSTHAALGEAPSPSKSSGSRWRTRLASVLRVGYGEMVDTTGPWILLGLALAALAAPLLQASWLRLVPPGLDVALFALLGMPTYVCASGATPLVAMLIFKGVSPGAAIAFLLTGPATNVTTFGVLSELHGRRVALTFAATVGGMAMALGYLVNRLLPPSEILAPLHPHEAHLSPLRLMAMLSLAFLFGLSLLRQGPRRFVGQVVPLALGEHSHGGHRGHSHAVPTAPASACCAQPQPDQEPLSNNPADDGHE